VVVTGIFEYENWTAIAGTTIWCKFFATSRSAATPTRSGKKPA
jgi:hypothetical protein